MNGPFLFVRGFRGNIIFCCGNDYQVRNRENKNESITVGFEKPMKVRQIVIAESYNPSTISIIHLLDTKYKKRLSVEFDPKQLSVESSIKKTLWL